MNMEVSYNRYVDIDKDNRVEFLLVNFDYIDGSDYLAKLFCEQYRMQAEDKLDGIWFSMIRLYSDDDIYELLWHEDTGNSVYSINQDESSVDKLEVRLNHILDELNSKIKAANNNK